MPTSDEEQLKAAVDKILESKSPKKLIVAGPGAGKTTLFKLLLELSRDNEKSRLVLTFINNLKNDLQRELSGLATVFTLHGYCQSLLHHQGELRQGLSGHFRCLPGMASLIKKDWECLGGEPTPKFVELMRNLASNEELEFYKHRADYYDAVDFDDSVYRVFQGLSSNHDLIEEYELVLIDEYQDFNRLEAGLIDLLASKSPIVVAGDDDQALYSQLKGASWEFIRSLYGGGEYEIFELPFCMRCPEVIVSAVNDIITVARRLKKLQGRIDKPYFHYAPVKGADSEKYPTIDLVRTTVQRANANYFGRYIDQEIRKISKEEIEQAVAKGEPAVLVIGTKPYLPQVSEYLAAQGYTIEVKEGDVRLEKADGFDILAQDPTANLGWRVMLEYEVEELASQIIREAEDRKLPLVRVLPDELRERILNDLKLSKKEKEERKQEAPERNEEKQFRIKLTSFEGAKGLSAQHVFILGMHEGEIPKDVNKIQDIEICRLLVGLTRTKKKCSMLLTKNFANKWKNPSVFLTWIKAQRFRLVEVDVKYWSK